MTGLSSLPTAGFCPAGVSTALTSVVVIVGVVVGVVAGVVGLWKSFPAYLSAAVILVANLYRSSPRV